MSYSPLQLRVRAEQASRREAWEQAKAYVRAYAGLLDPYFLMGYGDFARTIAAGAHVSSSITLRRRDSCTMSLCWESSMATTSRGEKRYERRR